MCDHFALCVYVYAFLLKRVPLSSVDSDFHSLPSQAHQLPLHWQHFRRFVYCFYAAATTASEHIFQFIPINLYMFTLLCINYEFLKSI